MPNFKKLPTAADSFRNFVERKLTVMDCGLLGGGLAVLVIVAFRYF